jgi:hypothetical protein
VSSALVQHAAVQQPVAPVEQTVLWRHVRHRLAGRAPQASAMHSHTYTYAAQDVKQRSQRRRAAEQSSVPLAARGCYGAHRLSPTMHEKRDTSRWGTALQMRVPASRRSGRRKTAASSDGGDCRRQRCCWDAAAAG